MVELENFHIATISSKRTDKIFITIITFFPLLPVKVPTVVTELDRFSF